MEKTNLNEAFCKKDGVMKKKNITAEKQKNLIKKNHHNKSNKKRDQFYCFSFFVKKIHDHNRIADLFCAYAQY